MYENLLEFRLSHDGAQVDETMMVAGDGGRSFLAFANGNVQYVCYE